MGKRAKARVRPVEDEADRIRELALRSGWRESDMKWRDAYLALKVAELSIIRERLEHEQQASRRSRWFTVGLLAWLGLGLGLVLSFLAADTFAVSDVLSTVLAGLTILYASATLGSRLGARQAGHEQDAVKPEIYLALYEEIHRRLQELNRTHVRDADNEEQVLTLSDHDVPGRSEE